MASGLKYPLILAHGMGFRDDKHFSYWGRITAALEKSGCKVYYGGQDSNGTVETNGAQLAERIRQVLAETGAEKVNIIGHSKGGLDARYAISSLGMADKVASLTTLATPHNGSVTMDKLMRLPKFLIRFVGACADLGSRLLGDRQPQSYRVFLSFTTARAAEFNAANPDAPGVYYQSYGCAMKHPFGDFLMWIPALVVWCIEGENDGLLSPEAMKWTNFRGVFRSVTGRGISHCDEIDLRRRRLTKKTGEGICDVVDIYVSIAEDLAKQGF